MVDAVTGSSLTQRASIARHEDYIITACMFCNTADNRYFDMAVERGIGFDGLTPEQLIAQRLPYVLATRDRYKAFWENKCKSECCPKIAGAARNKSANFLVLQSLIVKLDVRFSGW